MQKLSNHARATVRGKKVRGKKEKTAILRSRPEAVPLRNIERLGSRFLPGTLRPRFLLRSESDLDQPLPSTYPRQKLARAPGSWHPRPGGGRSRRHAAFRKQPDGPQQQF